MFTGHATRHGPTEAKRSEWIDAMERRPRVLLLDGDVGSRAGIATALCDCRIRVLTGADGESGLARLLDELLSLDALVVDLDLPGRGARELARLIRGDGNEQDLALVVVAAAPSPALRSELKRLGVDAVVDRREGAAAVAAAALGAIEARRDVEVVELETWRWAPPAPPVGETSMWPLGGGALAGA